MGGGLAKERHRTADTGADGIVFAVKILPAAARAQEAAVPCSVKEGWGRGRMLCGGIRLFVLRSSAYIKRPAG